MTESGPAYIPISVMRSRGYRAPMSAIAELLAECRRGLDRVAVPELAAELAAGALLVDTRPRDQRERDGELPGALVVERNVLEWRLDPTSPDRLPEVTSADVRVIVVCDEGYSSSLAAHSLRGLGLHRATDLVGGYQAWLASGSPAS
jgi:rhodanese-related sulfurtransferase